jgi:hypothetical protein
MKRSNKTFTASAGENSFVASLPGLELGTRHLEGRWSVFRPARFDFQLKPRADSPQGRESVSGSS